MSEARRVGSSEAPRNSGRDVGWIVCQPGDAKGSAALDVV